MSEFDAQPQAELTESVVNETNVDAGTDNTSQESTEPTTTVELSTEQPKLKVKYNHEEKELSYDEAVELAQKGMNYDKAIERAKQEAATQAAQAARDAYIAEQGYEWQGKAITTEAEYLQALREKEIYDSLQSQQLPDEVIQELMESRREREERNAEKLSKQQEERQTREYQEFFAAFPDAKPEDVKPEVWDKVANGVPLKYAYIEQQYQELQSKQEIIQTNQKNAESSTGSVTGNGATKDDGFITFDTFQANRGNQDWVNKNFKKIVDSRSKW